MNNEAMAQQATDVIADLILFAQDGCVEAILAIFGKAVQDVCAYLDMPHSEVVRMALQEIDDEKE